jgi:hypothetical protein
MGYAAEARWVKSMHYEKPDHALFWRLQERHGTAWIPAFFRLLKADEMDFERLPPPSRGLYLAGYLSLASNENLGDEFARLGLGRKPEDWENRFPDASFEPYRVTKEKVEALMKRREALFGQGTETSRLRDQRDRFRQGLNGP